MAALNVLSESYHKWAKLKVGIMTAINSLSESCHKWVKVKVGDYDCHKCESYHNWVKVSNYGVGELCCKY